MLSGSRIQLERVLNHYELERLVSLDYFVVKKILISGVAPENFDMG